MSKFRLNPKGVDTANLAFDEAWADVVAELEVEMEAVIEDPAAFADQGFTKNMVDSGRFQMSQQVAVKGGIATFTWGAKSPETGFPYPIALYSGFRAWGKGKYIPGRKWPEKAVDRVNVPETLKQKMIERGIKAKVKLKRKVFN